MTSWHKPILGLIIGALLAVVVALPYSKPTMALTATDYCKNRKTEYWRDAKCMEAFTRGRLDGSTVGVVSPFAGQKWCLTNTTPYHGKKPIIGCTQAYQAGNNEGSKSRNHSSGGSSGGSNSSGGSSGGNSNSSSGSNSNSTATSGPSAPAAATKESEPKPSKPLPIPDQISCGDKCKLDFNKLEIPTITLGTGVRAIINILAFIAGVLSVIFIIVAGIRYATTSGDTGRIEGAKQTLLYAVIGLIVSILAPLVAGFVAFVIG